MPVENEQRKAQEFLEKNRPGYLKLLETVKAVAQKVQQERLGEIKEIYSRGGKQRNKEELKSVEKLPRKLSSLRDKWSKSQSGSKTSMVGQPT